MRGLPAGAPGKMIFQREPLVLVFNLSAPSANMQKIFQVGEPSDHPIDLVTRINPQQQDDSARNRRLIDVLVLRPQAKKIMRQIKERIAPGQNDADEKSQTLPQDSFLLVQDLFRRRSFEGLRGWLHGTKAFISKSAAHRKRLAARCQSQSGKARGGQALQSATQFLVPQADLFDGNAPEAQRPSRRIFFQLEVRRA